MSFRRLNSSLPFVYHHKMAAVKSLKIVTFLLLVYAMVCECRVARKDLGLDLGLGLGGLGLGLGLGLGERAGSGGSGSTAASGSGTTSPRPTSAAALESSFKVYPSQAHKAGSGSSQGHGQGWPSSKERSAHAEVYGSTFGYVKKDGGN
ncbi:hypothetical protein RJ640_030388 [Escallonia rubra]|uniref:Uncharacterized protein n=1 Tax=Escallonia rubra TaxID=112253 RepID=A0AA88R438_9ASTE|nr:hypothetical protein RJ640_030388 [Escallonia rubra]